MTWSPENKISLPSSAKHRWSGAWPGVNTAWNDQPSPSRRSKCLSGTSGTKSCSTYSPPAALGARPARLVTVAGRLCGGGRAQGRQPVDVVMMRVGDEDMRDRPPAGRPQDGRQMRLIIGAGIDQGERAGADQIGVGALEGEVIGVVGDDAHDTGGELAWLAVGEVHRRLEGQGFAHRGSANGGVALGRGSQGNQGLQAKAR